MLPYPDSKLPLASDTWDNEELNAIYRVIASGRFTMGKEVAEFEEEFAAWNGSKYAVMVNSGSSANLLMVAALFYAGNLERGSEVHVPAVSWSTTYAPLMQYGIIPVLHDVDDTFCSPVDDPGGFAVHLLGNAAKLRYAPLMEDCCESMGAEYPNGNKVGTIGLMGSFSMFFSHHISTMEGGIIVTNSNSLYKLLLSLRAHGWTRDLPDHKPSFETAYEFVVPGYSVRPTELQGAIGKEQLKKLSTFIATRRENAKHYKGPLKENGKSSWFGFPYFSDCRETAIRELTAMGVDTRPVVAGNIARHKMMQYGEYRIHGELTMADKIHDQGYYIGNHGHDISKQLRNVEQYHAEN